MIDAVIQGRMHGTAKTRTGKNDKPFTTAMVRTATREQALFASVIAFDEQAQQALQALGDKDAVVLAGELTPKVWTDNDGNARPSLDVLVHKVLTAYHVQRKRAAMSTPSRQSNHFERTDDAEY